MPRSGIWSACSAEGANSLFGQTYWRTRVRQVSATRGLQREQRARLERLMKLLSDAGCVQAFER